MSGPFVGPWSHEESPSVAGVAAGHGGQAEGATGPYRPGVTSPEAHIAAEPPVVEAAPPYRPGGGPSEFEGHPEALAPAIESVTVRKVRRLTGPLPLEPTDSMRLGRVQGTDLGHLFDMGTSLYVVFGDTYGPAAPLPLPEGLEVSPEELKKWEWRSNTMAVIPDPGRFPEAGLTGGSMIADRRPDGTWYARALIDGAYQANNCQGEVTKIPTGGIAIDGRMFLHIMSIKCWGKPGEWRTNWSQLIYSDDGGWTWSLAPDVSWVSDSNFAQVAFVRADEHVYLYGTPAGRGGRVKLARVPADRDALLNPDAYRYFRGGGDPAWVVSEWEATTIAPGPDEPTDASVGELSIMYNEYLRRWIMMHIQPRGFVASGDPRFSGAPAIVVREAPRPTGPWSPPTGVCTGGYGSYMHPCLVRDGGEIVYFTMSRWFPGEEMGIRYDEAYNVYIMEARFRRR